jgi:hypothetical protein
MKIATLSLLTILAFGTASAFAAAPTPAPNKTETPQSARSIVCSNQAHTKALQGEAYKSYVDTCVKNASATSRPRHLSTEHRAKESKDDRSSRLELGKACHEKAKAKNLSGTELRKFLGTCMSE